jgi:hypothetical protein
MIWVTQWRIAPSIDPDHEQAGSGVPETAFTARLIAQTARRLS